MTDYMTIKVRDGAARIMRENPGLDFTASTPALEAAELRLNEKMYLYTRSPEVTEADVRAAFKAYEHELVEANRPAPATLFLVR